MAKRKVARTFALHHWCGLIAGVLLLVISLTGSILVFDDDIDNAVFAAHRRAVPAALRVSFDASLAQVRQAYPGLEIRIPELPAPGDNILYELRQGQERTWLFVHPESGRIASVIDRADLRVTNVLLNIHYNLLSGTVGKIVVLCTGITFLILLVTGCMLYRRSFLKVLLFRQKISWSNRRILFSSLHRVLGVWGLLFNLLMSLSGIWLGYLVVESALKSKKPAAPAQAVSFSVDAALQRTQQQYPEFDVTYIRFPVAGGVQFLGRLKSDPAYYGRFYSGISLDTAGAVSKAQFMKDRPWYDRSLRILQPLHFGDYAGLPVKILYSLGGILPALLSISGFVIWRGKKKKKKSVHSVQSGNSVRNPVFRDRKPVHH